MVKIKLYGPVSSTNEYVKLLLKHKIDSLSIEAEMEEMVEIEDLLRDNIASVPAVIIEDDPPMYINDIDNAINFTQEVVKRVIQMDIPSNSFHIIVPIDMSDASINALEYAIHFARDTQSSIKIVHFYHPVVTEIDGSVYVDPEEEKSRRDVFETFVSEITAHHNMDRYGGIVFESAFIQGFSIEGILELSKMPGKQIIIMGATGSSKLSKKIFGSVSLDIARRSECPVLIVPEGYDKCKIEKIALALESNHMNKKDAHFVQILRERLKAQLEIVTVTPDEGDWSSWGLEIDSLVGGKHIPGKYIQGDNVLEGLESYIESNDVDMMIFTPKKRNVFENIFHKSVTKQMAINSKVPLLVLHHSCHCQHGSNCCKMNNKAEFKSEG